MTLERAVAAKDAQAKLTALLAAWRKKKHPRIADLIDRVSEPLVRATGGPVKAKSVPERTKQVLAMLEKPDPVGVGRVLATEWPGTWEPALPVALALCRLEDDPRVAQCLAKQVDLTPYVSLSSVRLYRPLFARLDELADVRTKPLLESQLTRVKNPYYERNMRKLEERSVAAISKVKVPTLTAAEERWLAALEAPFASSAATEKARGQSGAELLAAVYANPSDIGLRVVYGDWLTQHGDPRGELISLQLAAPTPKSESRIRSLIKQHWRTWVGPLADWFTRGYSRGTEVAEFKAGFPVSCYVQDPKHESQEALRKLLDRPEWRTIERLFSWPTWTLPIHEALAHPNFALVKRLGFSLSHSDLAPLVEQGNSRIEELELWLTDNDPPLELSRLTGVRRLTARAPSLPHLLTLLPQLDVLRLESDRLTPAHWRLLEKSGVQRVTYANVIVSRAKGAPHFTTLERRQDVPTPEEDELFAAFKHLKLAPRVGPKVVSGQLSAPLRTDALVAAVWSALTTGFGVTFDALDIGGVEHDLTKDPVKRIQVRCRNEKNYYVHLSHRQKTGDGFSLWKDSTKFDLRMPDVEAWLTGFRSLAALVPKDTRVSVDFGGKSVEATAGALKKVETFVRAL